MGWVYGFHSLNPAVIRELLELPTDEIRRRLIQRGVSPERVGVESWDDPDFDENEALTVLATTREWDVEKSLEDIRAYAGRDPGLAPVAAALREMESFGASQLPDRFHPRETGLMGIAMPATVKAAAAAAAPFMSPESRPRFGESKRSLLQRLFGHGVRARLSSNDYLWQHWTDFGKALQYAAEHDEWLGLHMS
jgi:hypothetical protein